MCLFCLPQYFFPTSYIRELVYLKVYSRFETSSYNGQVINIHNIVIWVKSIPFMCNIENWMFA